MWKIGHGYRLIIKRYKERTGVHMNKHCSNEVLYENRPEIQMRSWIIFERKIGKRIFFLFLKSREPPVFSIIECQVTVRIAC